MRQEETEMSTRITTRDLNGMLKRLERNMATHGMLTHSLGYETGSKLNGNSYNIVMGGDRTPFGTFHWGFTARDFYDRMHTMCVALEAVTYAKGGQES